MDGVQQLADFWAYIVDLIQGNLWFAKLIGLAAFILAMVMVVALLYSGEVQNSEKGPISLVSRSSLNDNAFQCIDPIVTNNLDGKRAMCTFYLAYVDRRQRPRRKKLHRARLEFKKLNRTPPRETKSTLVGFWNPPRHEELLFAIQDAEVVPDAPNLFAEKREQQDPPPSEEYFAREVLETKTVAVSAKTLAAIGAAQCAFLKQHFSSIQRIRRDKNGVRRLEGKPAYVNLPNLSEDGHYFVEMKFAIDPWFVLTEHPDGQVKTTAWLTVLTSLFAMFMQLLYSGLS